MYRLYNHLSVGLFVLTVIHFTYSPFGYYWCKNLIIVNSSLLVFLNNCQTLEVTEWNARIQIVSSAKSDLL